MYEQLGDFFDFVGLLYILCYSCAWWLVLVFLWYVWHFLKWNFIHPILHIFTVSRSSIGQSHHRCCRHFCLQNTYSPSSIFISAAHHHFFSFLLQPPQKQQPSHRTIRSDRKTFLPPWPHPHPTHSPLYLSVLPLSHTLQRYIGGMHHQCRLSPTQLRFSRLLRASHQDLLNRCL